MTFDEFWVLYPRKVGKHKAKQTWERLRLSAPDLHRIRVALSWQVPHWAESGTLQYVPHPTTWLNGRRWEDEPPPSVEAARPHLSPDVVRWLKNKQGE